MDVTMASNGAIGADRYILPDYVQASGFVNTGYRDTNGRVARSAVVNTAIRNLVLITAGQSNGMNINPTLYTATNASVIDNVDVYDGGFYDTAGPLLGCQYAPASNGPGNLGLRVADLLVTNNKFDHIYIVPLALSGSSVSVWGSGGALQDRISVAVRRMAARGITPATTNVTFALLWLQGEADGTLGTTSSAYQTAFGQLVANAQAAGFSGRIFVPTETWQAGAASATIQGAQAALRDSVTIFDGGNLDSLNASNRQADNTHFNDTGAAAAATLIYNAMHASGVPF
jgi:hypothetical protein